MSYLKPLKTPLFKVFQPEGIAKAVADTFSSGFIAEGAKTAQFQQEVGKFIHNPQTVLMNSCTMAITVAYRLCGVEPGTEVVTTPLTCVASNQPILSLGAKAVWADCDRATGMITADTIKPKLTEKTKAILVLHKEGDLARMDEILKLAHSHGIKVIEDSAHAFGASYKGRPVGTVGDFACFSFQAIKHITTGDGGALSCKSEEDFLRAKRLKWFGVDRDARTDISPWEQDVKEWGYKGNMNDLQSTVGLEQIKHAHEIVSRFHAVGERYSKLLKDVPGVTLIQRDEADYSSYWAYCMVVENRKGLITKLHDNGIGAAQIHPRNDIYSMFEESKCVLPETDWFNSRELSIPSGWWVTDEEQDRICEVIRSGW
jgi:perosamine synthetase